MSLKVRPMSCSMTHGMRCDSVLQHHHGVLWSQCQYSGGEPGSRPPKWFYNDCFVMVSDDVSWPHVEWAAQWDNGMTIVTLHNSWCLPCSGPVHHIIFTIGDQVLDEACYFNYIINKNTKWITIQHGFSVLSSIILYILRSYVLYA